MQDGSVETALARIEAALSRIETLAARPVNADPALEERHRRLRDAVGQSLRQLDDLLGDGAR
jgi:hypothetical protein